MYLMARKLGFNGFNIAYMLIKTLLVNKVSRNTITGVMTIGYNEHRRQTKAGKPQIFCMKALN